MSIEQAPHDLNWATHHLIYHSGCGDDFIMWLFYFILFYWFFMLFYWFLYFFSRFCPSALLLLSFPQEDYADPCPKLNNFVGRFSFLGNSELACIRVGYMYALDWRFSKIKEPTILTLDRQFLKNQRMDSHPWSTITKNQRINSHPWLTITKNQRTDSHPWSTIFQKSKNRF
jgi:hypothetical protein